MPSPPEPSPWDFPNAATPLGSPLYYAIRFAPPEQRRPLALIVAWYAQVRAVAEQPRDPGVARLKLDWWRQETGRMTAGQARHPLAVGIQAIPTLTDRAAASMLPIIDATEAEIRDPVLTDATAFHAACDATFGELATLAAHIDTGTPANAGPERRLGAYIEAVERVRLAVVCPHRLPRKPGPGDVGSLDAAARSRRIETLLEAAAGRAATGTRQAGSGFVRRLAAMQRALQVKLRAADYPVNQTPVERAPIAQLWTAWRTR